MICTLSKHEAESKGYADAMMLDYRGQVAEATGANMFFVQDDVIHTPTPDYFLDGITRRTVIELARARGHEIVERAIMPDELADFSECFITGTAAEVTPVSEIGPYKFIPSDISKNLMDDYTALVNEFKAEVKTASNPYQSVPRFLDSEESVMSLYEKHVLPRLIGAACGIKPILKLREKVRAALRRRVLEIGMGTGHNLGYYDPGKVDMVGAGTGSIW